MHASNQSKPEVLIFVLIGANCLQMRQFMTKLIIQALHPVKTQPSLIRVFTDIT